MHPSYSRPSLRGRAAFHPRSSADSTPQDDSEPQTQSERLIGYGTGPGVELFTTPDRTPYVAFQHDGRRVTTRLRDSTYRQRLRYLYYQDESRSPSSQALQDAIDTLAAIAEFEGPTRPVPLRTAAHEGALYVDLANEEWTAIRIRRRGWSFVSRPPVYFRRTPSMDALPMPRRGGCLSELQQFIRLKSEEDFALLIAYLVQALRPQGPYPILVFTGEQGTGKSTASRMVRALIDPSPVPLRTPPSSERDLVIAAENNWCLGFDNLDAPPANLSNALCRLATGGGFGKRALYSNRDEAIFAAQRPMLLNGIEDLTARPDLRERALVLELAPIPPAERRTEADLWAAFERARPRLLGALLDALACALRRYDTVALEGLPRMADFARWAAAAEPAGPLSSGTFMAAHAANTAAGVDRLVDASPVAAAIVDLLETEPLWHGTTADLLEALRAHVPNPDRPPADFPGSYQALAAEMKRLQPVLRALDIERVDDPQVRSRGFTLQRT
jgi:hypothetical protein